jgi:hypothetical protein
MARFNLDDYETVESRIRKLFEIYPDARIVTKWLNDFRLNEAGDTYIVKASIYLTAGDQANKLAKATGLAVEVAKGPQADWAMELAETSSIGRALANMNLSGNRRASREEMEKVNRATATDWLAEAEQILNVNDLRALYTRAKAQGAPTEVLEKLKDYANALNTSEQDSGTRGSAKGSAGGKKL